MHNSCMNQHHFKRLNASTVRDDFGYHPATISQIDEENSHGSFPARRAARQRSATPIRPARTASNSSSSRIRDRKSSRVLFERWATAKVATHRTKDISVWRQGDINYLLNARAAARMR